MEKRRRESAWIKTNESLLAVLTWLLCIFYFAFSSSLIVFKKKSDKKEGKVTKNEERKRFMGLDPGNKRERGGEKRGLTTRGNKVQSEYFIEALQWKKTDIKIKGMVGRQEVRADGWRGRRRGGGR